MITDLKGQGMQVTSIILCFVAIFCMNVFTCKGFHHVGSSKSISHDRISTSLIYNVNNFNLEKAEVSAPPSNFGVRRMLSTSLSMSSSDDGIGKVNLFLTTTNYL